MTEWRDIATAPRDGTEVWLWNANASKILKGVRWTIEEKREGFTIDGWKDGSSGKNGCYTEEQFSHWMLPMPDPGPPLPHNGIEP